MRQWPLFPSKGALSFFAWLLCCLPSILSAQSFFPFHYKVDDGLPSNTIYRIVQDVDGYIWIGTQNGLCRFDGSRFVVYAHPAMSDQDIIHLDASPNSAIVGFTNVTRQVGVATKDSIRMLNVRSPQVTLVNDIVFGEENNYWIWTSPANDSLSTLQEYNLNDELLRETSTLSEGLTELYWDTRAKRLLSIGYRISVYAKNSMSKVDISRHFSEIKAKIKYKDFNHGILGKNLQRKTSDSWFFTMHFPLKKLNCHSEFVVSGRQHHPHR